MNLDLGSTILIIICSVLGISVVAYRSRAEKQNADKRTKDLEHALEKNELLKQIESTDLDTLVDAANNERHNSGE